MMYGPKNEDVCETRLRVISTKLMSCEFIQPGIIYQTHDNQSVFDSTS
jgi:hypothetical protein